MWYPSTDVHNNQLALEKLNIYNINHKRLKLAPSSSFTKYLSIEEEKRRLHVESAIAKIEEYQDDRFSKNTIELIRENFW